MLTRYTRWLHTQWPSGAVERLPETGAHGATAVPGLRIVGGLAGFPLLRSSADSGASALRAVLAEKAFRRSTDPELLDVAIVGAGVSGVAAAIEAKQAALRFVLFEAVQPFASVASLPKTKAIYPGPSDQTDSSGLRISGTSKEALLADLERQRAQAGIEPRQVRIEWVERKGSELLLHHADSRVTRAQRVVVGIGREAPQDFLRRSGVPLRGHWDAATRIGLFLSLLLCFVLFHWTGNHSEFPFQQFVAEHRAFPFDVPVALDAMSGAIAAAANDETTLLYTLRLGLGNPSFYYAFLYCAAVVVFGVRRVRRRRTPYVFWQTLTLMFVLGVFLFLLPEIVLPWVGRNGYFERGQTFRWLADNLFERTDGFLGHERAYWRAYGLVLPFPLNVYNVFTDRPMWLWLAISVVQTLVLVPIIVRRWGKGGYCGWICSSGALAETMGDVHREKMPHGPVWNRVNMVGQGVLGVVVLLLVLRILGWTYGDNTWPATWHRAVLHGIPFLNYAWLVDVFLAGVVGIGAYFWFSGRVWCRFACPLGALMNIYGRFSLFRIIPDESKCISCNVCTSVCHQGVDVMNFANEDRPMQDPQCVRCSACVQGCPTGALSLGYVRPSGEVIFDTLKASPVQIKEAGA